MTARLEARDLSVGYSGQPVVSHINFSVEAGEILALLGPNGAGKTTTILTLCGELAPITGDVVLFGKTSRVALYRRARQGLGLVTEERSVFMNMSVSDNLKVGGGSVSRALEIFPELHDHLGRQASLLSGGQQQMLALGRLLARSPRVLLADELSLGLAPLLVERLLDRVRTAAKEDGIAVVLVEQHVAQALHLADYAVVLGNGRVQLEGTAEQVRGQSEELEQAYLSTAAREEEGP